MSDNEKSVEPFWGILEMLGHVRIAGRISDVPMFGAKLGRVDIPDKDGGFTTQFFGGGSVYRLTPTTEEIARAVAKESQSEPVYVWDLRRQLEQKALPPAPPPFDDPTIPDDDEDVEDIEDVEEPSDTEPVPPYVERKPPPFPGAEQEPF